MDVDSARRGAVVDLEAVSPRRLCARKDCRCRLRRGTHNAIRHNDRARFWSDFSWSARRPRSRMEISTLLRRSLHWESGEFGVRRGERGHSNWFLVSYSVTMLNFNREQNRCLVFLVPFGVHISFMYRLCPLCPQVRYSGTHGLVPGRFSGTVTVPRLTYR